eukprot:jgi/Botrbrau1/96/Bobra.0022s0086.1
MRVWFFHSNELFLNQPFRHVFCTKFCTGFLIGILLQSRRSAVSGSCLFGDCVKPIRFGEAENPKVEEHDNVLYNTVHNLSMAVHPPQSDRRGVHGALQVHLRTRLRTEHKTKNKKHISDSQQMEPSQGNSTRGPCGDKAGDHLEVWRWIEHSLAAGNWSEESITCFQDFGLGFLVGWKERHHQYCAPDPASPTASSVDCFMGPQMRYADRKHFTVCESRNGVLLDSKKHVTTQHEAWRVPSSLLPHNFYLDCQPNATRLPASAAYFHDGSFLTSTAREWFRGASAVYGDEAKVLVETACGPEAQHVVEHPVLFTARCDETNAFHFHEALVTTFLSLALADLPPEDRAAGLEVVIVDDEPEDHRFMDFYRLLSWPHPVRNLRKQPYPPNTCFRRAIHNIVGWRFTAYIHLRGCPVHVPQLSRASCLPLVALSLWAGEGG